ncbi:MAG: tRNA uracil 4-sulfurtransferase ThiI [Bdellovibrionota bacterium]
MIKILVRMSPELTIKSDRVRRKFQKILVNNINAAFTDEGLKFSLQNSWSRIYLTLESEEGIEVLKRIFGIHSFSIVEGECVSNLDDIIEMGLKVFRPQISLDESFAVRTKRSGKRLPFTSVDVNRQLGAALNVGVDNVDLTNPERRFFVEVRTETTFFFSQSIKGAGGLPLGSAGRAVCLISGGFDSPVAAWMLMKRGVHLDFVLCNIAGAAFERSVLEITSALVKRWGYGMNKSRFFSIPFDTLVVELKEKVAAKYVQVILKRLFYRAASKIVNVYDADAIVTGEAIGQVSSQTMKNLRTINVVTDLPVFRPLLSFDKEEIIELSKRIGTHDLCVSVQEFCHLVPDKPATACSLENADKAESVFDLSLLENAVKATRPILIKRLNAADLIFPYVSINYVPDNSVVVDCRSEELFEEWHFPKASNIEYHKVLGDFKNWDKSKTYLLYCPIGMQSTVLAEKMQSNGYLSYSFKGGVEQLKQYLKSLEE